MIFEYSAYKIDVCIFKEGFYMLRKLLLFALGLVMVLPARAELKVDIVAGAANPISIAVQKFEGLLLVALFYF